MSTTEQVTALTPGNTGKVAAEWVDIIGPTLPTDVFPWWWLGAGVVIMSVLLLILYIWLRQPRFSARVQLAMLRIKLERKTTSDYRAVARSVARVIATRSWPLSPQVNRTALAESFHQQLNYACYSPATPTKTDVLSLLRTAKALLKHADRFQHSGTQQVLS